MIASAGPVLDWTLLSDWAAPLLDLTLKGALILALASLGSCLARSRPAALRHWIWSLAFACLAALPLANWALPAWHVQIPALEEALAFDTRSPREQIEASLLPPLIEQTSPVLADGYAPPQTTLSSDTPSPRNALAWISLIWLAGATLLFVRLLLDVLRLLWFSASGRTIHSPDWQLVFQHCTTRIGLERPVRFKLSRHVATPMTFGFARPVVLLPHAFASWSMNRWHAVLLHELAHIKRGDFVTNVLALFVCALYWPNPLVWTAARRLRAERERACDDSVLRQGLDEIDYAEHLLGVARHLTRTRRPGPTIVAMAHRPSVLGTRIRAILDRRIPRDAVHARALVATGLLALAFLLPLAPLQPGDAPPSIPVVQDATLIGWIEDLSNPQAEIREEAVLHLGLTRPPRAADALIRSLYDPSVDVRGMAAWALGRIGAGSAVYALAELTNDPDLFVREMAIRALGLIGDERAFCTLVKQVREDDAQLRATIVWALGRIGTSPALRAVAVALDDTDPYVRHVAEHALLTSENDQTECVLRQLMGEKDLPLRKRIALILDLRRSSSTSLS